MAKAEYKRRNDVKFINPYTFVPISRQQSVERKEAGTDSEVKLHTGVLHCRLYVRTPLGIPDAEQGKIDPRVDGHKIYPFFSYMENGQKVPAIPGSSLRGAIRSVFETATDSCFSTLRENTGLSKRVGNREAYKPGILKWEKDTWRLYEADRYLLAVDRDCKGNSYAKYEGLPDSVYVAIEQEEKGGARMAITNSGEKLRFGDLVEFQPYSEGKAQYRKNGFLIWSGVAADVRKKQAGEKCRNGKTEGIVYIGETFGRKKHGENVFAPKKEVKNFSAEQLKKAYEGLLETLESYRDPAINRHRNTGHSGYRDFEHAKKETGIPLWYAIKDKKLCLASIGRTFYNTTLNELVGERKPCISRQKLCEACLLFGMAGEESLGSRIRVTDAEAVEGYVLKEKTLQILGQPRYSYLPFYTRNGAGSSDSRSIPDTYDESDVEIAGRKFFWHNAEAATDSNQYETKKKEKMNSTMELVMPGAEFCFDLYYDGITQEQIQKIMWCIHLGENNENGDLCYKIGHGKPLGLGSVKLVIEENVERVFEDGSYTWKREKPIEKRMEPSFKKSRELKRVMNFHGPDAKIPIKYPFICDEQGEEVRETGRNVNEGARHVWYQENKRAGGKFHGESNDSVEALPNIMAKDQTLHAYQKIEKKEWKANDWNGTGNKRNHGSWSGRV